MRIPLKELAAGLGAVLDSPVVATGWSVDTRTMEPGDVYFALRGPNHDGHEHVAAAFEKGACAAVAERETGGGPTIRVADTLAALQRAAGWARARWGGGVVAITGSAGKTTTKEAVARMLSVRGTVGKTTGNFNNHVGVPLSLLRLPDDAKLGVIEIGMNHAGEIRNLAAIAKPDVAVVTNVGSAHIENFDSIEGVAAAKRELVESLTEDGVAVLNADDARVAGFRGAHSGRVVTYGLGAEADVRAEDVELLADGVRFRVGTARFESPVAGRIGVSNLLAGIAVAGVCGIAAEELVEAARGFEPGKMRGARFVRDGVLIFDDCYHANPDGMRAMVDVLRDARAERRIAVLGEILELGRWAEPLHREVGKYVASQGIDVLVGIRGVARSLVDAAIEGGLPTNAALFFAEPGDAGAHLKTMARSGDAILFKGSRGTHVERALERYLG